MDKKRERWFEKDMRGWDRGGGEGKEVSASVSFSVSVGLS